MHLEQLAGSPSRLRRKGEASPATKWPKSYEPALARLPHLRDPTRRVEALRIALGRKSTLIGPLG